MLIIPAIDIMGGKVVRLSGGDFKKETVYGDDPVAAAKMWEQEGAEFIHIVDLDGAREGMPVNFGVICSILENLSIPVEVGGGIRDRDTIKKFLDAGVKLVVLGTKAADSIEFVRDVSDEFAESIAVSVDSAEGKVAIRGWVDRTSKSAVELIKEVEKIGIRNIIFTDIKRDGLLSGIDIKNIEEVLMSATCQITIAGGISSLEDIGKLTKYGMPGSADAHLRSHLRGVIVGKALYAGTIQLKEAIQCANSSLTNRA